MSGFLASTTALSTSWPLTLSSVTMHGPPLGPETTKPLARERSEKTRTAESFEGFPDTYVRMHTTSANSF